MRFQGVAHFLGVVRCLAACQHPAAQRSLLAGSLKFHKENEEGELSSCGSVFRLGILRQYSPLMLCTMIETCTVRGTCVIIKVVNLVPHVHIA